MIDATGGEALLPGRIAQLESLAGLDTAVARVADPEGLYRAVLGCLEETLRPARASILLADADGVLRFALPDGLTDGCRTAIEAAPPWPSGVASVEPVVVGKDDAPSAAAWRVALERDGVRTLGVFPLLPRDRRIRALTLALDETQDFGADELRLAATIGGHVAAAIERHRTDAELRVRTAELERARFAAQRMQAVALTLAGLVDETEVARVLADEAAKAL